MIRPSKPEAFKLLMDGTLALADVEANGMRIDVPYLDNAIVETRNRLKEMDSDLRSDAIFRRWKKVYGERADIGSPQQLAHIIFDELKIEPKYRTATGRPSTNVSALEEIDDPFVKKIIERRQLEKVLTTFLMGVRNETVDGFLHSFFNLHLVETFRSSSDTINFQNIPTRNKIQARLIRQAFIPRDGHVLVEIDYGAQEFRIAACFWKDPGMVAYASDPSLDIHRDMAAECYGLDVDQITKPCRTVGKNSFVFPTLYGSYYGSTAYDLWAKVERMGLKTVDGVDLRDHLKSIGIHGLGDKKQLSDPPRGTYYRFVKDVEDNFNRRFSHWSEEKVRWWRLYEERGWYELMTGFVCSGINSYNNLMNTPIQGPAFHVLLWSLIQLNNWLKKYKMKTKIIGQIHDCIVADVHRSELDDYLETARRIMSIDVRKQWSWVIVPLEIEIEIAEKNWFEKKLLAS